MALRGPSSASTPRSRFCRALAAARRALLHHFRVLRPAIAIAYRFALGLCSLRCLSAVCAGCSPAPKVGARCRSVMSCKNECLKDAMAALRPQPKLALVASVLHAASTNRGAAPKKREQCVHRCAARVERVLRDANSALHHCRCSRSAPYCLAWQTGKWS